MKACFSIIEGNAFLGTIVPKSSIKDQFVPLQIRNLEQLVPLLAINDHFVPKNQKHVPISSRNTKKRNNLFLLFKKGPFKNQERERLRKTKCAQKHP